jgi:hypothetical protein
VSEGVTTMRSVSFADVSNTTDARLTNNMDESYLWIISQMDGMLYCSKDTG